MSPRGSRVNTSLAHEAPLAMMVPLIILGFGSIFVGYCFKDVIIGMGTTGLGNAVFVQPEHVSQINGEFLSPLTKMIPVILSLTGAATAVLLYFNTPKAPYIRSIVIFLSNK